MAWLWSQPSFAVPGTSCPHITRPDLVAGLDDRRCLIVDLKRTSKSDLGTVVMPTQDASFETWTKPLTAMNSSLSGAGYTRCRRQMTAWSGSNL